MYALLLAIIYISFISLGLPDSLLGAAWPVMREQMNAPISYAGLVSMVITVGTIVSSLLSERFTKKLGAGLVTAVSVLMTAAALFGFSVSGSVWALILWAIPFGLGAGAVDAALNNYVAVHFASRHMNWLHCFWGLGASVSPYIMSYYLTGGAQWNDGYRAVAIIQAVLTAVLFATLPLWKTHKDTASATQRESAHMSLSRVFHIRGVSYVLIAFFAYCALETTAGLWAASYLTLARGVHTETAAKYASLFYLGITVGRFLCGFVSDKIGDKNIIRLGIAVVLAGIAAIWLPLETDTLCLYGLVVLGLGCAPIYPAIIHSTPANFGVENSQAIVGVQMASAYTGSALIPPLFGYVANYISIGLFAAYLFIFAVLMLVMTEKLNCLLARG